MKRLPFERCSILLLALLVLACPSLAQDKKSGDQTIDPSKFITIPPSPVLSPEEALKSFVIDEGFEVQIVAAEPLVEDPVCMAWDERGRLWVCEMRGYMPNLNGDGEDQPSGNIVILEDTDADGVMDKRTVWLDGIVLPRAIAFARSGVLYADFESLYFVRMNANGSAGARIPVDRKYSDNGGSKSNVEHQANGLLYALDNWYYSANSSKRYRQSGTRFRPEDTEFRGQWGISQDDDGNLLANRNPVPIEYEVLPPNASKRNPNFKFNAPIVKVNPDVYPARVTPGANRAYNEFEVDHTTWKLKGATSACGPVIYRGTQFPAEYYNNVFIAEPAANLLKRVILEKDAGGKPKARQAYKDHEFLASTDERSRFVNTYVGPDGALYVVDMYRGVIQHKTYVSDYLRNQVKSRGLETPVGLGRIYRIVHKASPIDHTPVNLADMDSAQLVAMLGHPNAWQRENAQRLLVQRNKEESVALLEKAGASDENPQARIHALWALEGMGKLTPAALVAAGQTTDERVRVQVLRLAEKFSGTEDAAALVALLERYNQSPSYAMDLQVALSGGVLAGIDTPQAYDVLLSVLERRGTDALFRSAIVSGLEGKEAVFLGMVGNGPIKEQLTGALVKAVENGNLSIGSLLELVDSDGFKDKRNELLKSLASQSVQQNRTEVLVSLVERMAAEGATLESQRSILEGFVEGSQNSSSPAQFDGKPELFAKWQSAPPEGLAELVGKLDKIFEYQIVILTKEMIERIEAGRMHFGSHCSGCHGEDGNGLEGAGPPLVGSDWVHGKHEMLALLVLNGLEGPITINGTRYEPPKIQANMPGFIQDTSITDLDIANMITYVRSRQMGNHGDAVEPETVAAMRKLSLNRGRPYTPEELARIGGPTPPPSPMADVIHADWLDNSGRNLVLTLLAVTVPLALLLLVTLFGGGAKTEAH